MIDTPHIFIDKEEFLQWSTGIMTANWAAPLDLSEEFFKYVIDHMELLDNQFINKQGNVRFKLSRIHLIASPL